MGQELERVNPEELIFALDIGTRSIIGVVGVQEENLFRILDTERCEHPKRAMIDGQIEDIGQVARVAALVKSKLEERLGFPLRRVCVAAAGRALRTARAEFTLDVATGEGITPQQVYELEMGAVSLAREKIYAEAQENQKFYCVGHAVVRYYLDDYPFSTILSHRGSVARVDVIATFLPHEVVDSLCASMAMIGCEIDNLTLEPIAAMNAVLPSELRLLNLALVDIGAGTSDIAISENGSVAAYTMATVAGDEITEELIRKYLVDFQTAEALKHAAARGEETVNYKDILGFDYSVSLKELLDTLRPAVESLGQVICEKILEANGKSPMAVFLVGGGSLIPLLCEIVAENLGIDRKKVAVGGNNFIKRVVDAPEAVSGPEYATPLGIALTAAANGKQHGFYVKLNGQRVRLFRNDAMAVMDVLLLCGYQYRQLMGKNGKSITYQLNGEKRFVRGGYLKPAEIMVNGVQASISTPVHCDDEIDVSEAQDGEDAMVTLDSLGLYPQVRRITLNAAPMEAGCRIFINGKEAKAGQRIRDLDVIQVLQVDTLEDLCRQADIPMDNCIFVVNDQPGKTDCQLRDGDRVVRIPTREVFREAEKPRPEDLPESAAATGTSAPEQSAPPSVGAAREVPAADPAPAPHPEERKIPEAPAAPDAAQGYTAAEPDDYRPASAAQTDRMAAAPVNSGAAARAEEAEPVLDPAQPAEPAYRQPEAAQTDTPERKIESAWTRHQRSIPVTINDKTVLLPMKENGAPYQFIDMLNFVDLDPTKPQGDIVLSLNGENASYLAEVHPNDVIEIRWENELI